MSIGAKIIEDLGNNKYVIEVDPVDTKTHPTIVGVCHDYALFSTWTYMFTDGDCRIPIGNGKSTSNTLAVAASVQIPIRQMGEVVLPYLKESEYLKEEHYSKYCVWNEESIVRVWADGKTIHVYDKEAKKYVEIPETLYKQLKG